MKIDKQLFLQQLGKYSLYDLLKTYNENKELINAYIHGDTIENFTGTANSFNALLISFYRIVSDNSFRGFSIIHRVALYDSKKLVKTFQRNESIFDSLYRISIVTYPNTLYRFFSNCSRTCICIICRKETRRYLLLLKLFKSVNNIIIKDNCLITFDDFE